MRQAHRPRRTVVSVKKFADGDLVWTTLAKSSNTIEAAWVSLFDDYEWRIIQENARLRRVNVNPRWSSTAAGTSSYARAGTTVGVRQSFAAMRGSSSRCGVPTV